MSRNYDGLPPPPGLPQGRAAPTRVRSDVEQRALVDLQLSRDYTWTGFFCERIPDWVMTVDDFIEAKIAWEEAEDAALLKEYNEPPERASRRIDPSLPLHLSFPYLTCPYERRYFLREALLSETSETDIGDFANCDNFDKILHEPLHESLHEPLHETHNESSDKRSDKFTHGLSIEDPREPLRELPDKILREPSNERPCDNLIEIPCMSLNELRQSEGMFALDPGKIMKKQRKHDKALQRLLELAVPTTSCCTKVDWVQYDVDGGDEYNSCNNYDSYNIYNNYDDYDEFGKHVKPVSPLDVLAMCAQQIDTQAPREAAETIVILNGQRDNISSATSKCAIIPCSHKIHKRRRGIKRRKEHVVRRRLEKKRDAILGIKKG